MFKSNIFGNGKNITKGFWHLDGNSKDFSGNSKNGVDTNVSYPFNQNRRVGSYDGSSSNTELDTASNLGIGGNSFTIALKFKTTTTTFNRYFLGVQANNSYTFWGWCGLRINSSNTIGFVFYDTSGNFYEVYNSTVTLNNNTWHKAFIVCSGTTLKLYIDKNLIYSTNFSGAVSLNTSAKLHIGSSYENAAGNFVNSLIKDVIIENRPWSIREIIEYGETERQFGLSYYSPIKKFLALLTNQTFNLIADSASFSLTGYAALFHKYTKILLSAGSFALTGIAALFKKITKMSVTTGEFFLYGIDLVFHRLSHLVMSVGSFALTGIDVIIIKGKAIFMSAGNFVVTGSELNFHRLIHLVTSVGTYTLSGINALFYKVTKGLLDFGSFVVTGQNILFHRVINLMASVGNYVFTGQNSMFHKMISVMLGHGSFSLTGIDMLFHRVYNAVLSAGNFILSGFAVIIRGSGSWLWIRRPKNDDDWTRTPKE